MNVIFADIGMKQLNLKSPSSYQHCRRVAAIALRLSNYLSVAEENKESFIRGCYLHDIGKLFIPNRILNKRARLSDQEWLIMRQHPYCGRVAAGNYTDVSSITMDIVTYHHERWDGTGYPEGLSGNNIPYYARICALIDTFDSMMSNRCYRNRLTYTDTIAELRRGSGTQFDPDLVEPFISFLNATLIHEALYSHSAAI